MKNFTCISIILSVYKEPINWIIQSIDSILNQTFNDFEFIIVNDNPSSKEHQELLQEYEKKDKRIKVIYNQENLGLTKSLNIALKVAKGKYIARMDADDIAYPLRLEKQFLFMEQNVNIVASGTQIKFFGKKHKRGYDRLYLPIDPVQINDNFILQNPNFPPIAHPTAIIRRSILVDNQLSYNENFKTSQDYGLWNELIKYGEISNLDEILLDYRLSNNQITHNKINDQVGTVKIVLRDHLNFFFKSNNINIIVPINEITLKDISNLKREQKKYCKLKNKFNAIIFCYYLSLTNYNTKTLVYYILSLDFIKTSVPLKERIKVFLKIYGSKKFPKYL